MPPLVFLALLVVAGSLINGFLGSMRRIGFWGAFFGSIVLTPILGFLLVAISGPARPPKS